ncbi:hypothetical protein AQUCO_02800062v1 [Aquilegia coerulea]|uniref:Uncharacterized protein n=1 Tax=Aquilegia coerulea TaxID=218851 RepID=A0A2G5D3Q9_AQUCA|nr:hypothetical protein AQUCO_02800062v1 [Aquilegia coerulea]
MKKLYKKGKVHPSPPLISDHLAFLPATILTLTVALSPQDREVLAYLLLSCSTSPTTNFSTSNNKKNSHKNINKNNSNGVGREHPPLFYCNCFRCYTSYWVRWDSSPNRQLIHDIIDAFEDELSQKKKKNNKKERKKKGINGLKRLEDAYDDDDDSSQVMSGNLSAESVVVNSCLGHHDNDNDYGTSSCSAEHYEEEMENLKKVSKKIC